MNWDLLPTPNPSEFAVRVWASPNEVVNKLNDLAQGTTRLRSFDMTPVVPLPEGTANYIYWDMEGPNAEGLMGFLFVKEKTQLEIDTAIEEFTIQKDDFWWPQILESFKIYCNDDDPQWTALAVSRQAYVFVLQKRVRPSFRGATSVVVRRYWSHTPWAAEDLESEPMEPRNVEYDLLVLRGVIKDCIGPAVKVPGLAGSGGVERLYDIADANPASTEVAAYPARNYAATNYTTWEDHIYLATQQPLRGGYLKTTYEALAPPLTAIET